MEISNQINSDNVRKSSIVTQSLRVDNTSTKSLKSGFIKPTTIATYIGVFALLISVVAVGYRAPQSTTAVANINNVPSKPDTNTNSTSVDQVVATNIAAGMAEKANLAVAANVANMSVSLTARSELTQSDEAFVSKPQIIGATAENREIITYTAKAGDNVESVAKEHGVTARTVKWANDLTSDALEDGRKIVIPPVDGVVHTVTADDTVDSLASKYRSNKDRIIAFNDLELSGLEKGTRIVLPGGVLPDNQQPGYSAPSVTPAYNANIAHTPVRRSPSINNAGGNAYAFGNCTYYAYNRRAELGRPVGSFWGNANTWAMNAAAAGFAVNGSPSPGAVFQDNSGYFGHVGIVESVNPDGSINVSEMNYYGGGGGFNIISRRTISAGQARAYSYIH